MKPSLQSLTISLSRMHVKPAFVVLFSAVNVKVIEVDVVVVSFPTGSPFPSVADVIIVSRGAGSGTTVHTQVAGVVSHRQRLLL
ncbi:MAG: hypothetical protein K0R16_209 [Nitrososphaeraceae archaeon]|nr:hypothetical protein [Nitrososphaeraceae archaeon]